MQNTKVEKSVRDSRTDRIDRIIDLLSEHLEKDGRHSLQNIPRAVFHIQAHGVEDNNRRLTHPGIPIFPTRALSIVGYNMFGMFQYCPDNINETVTITDTEGRINIIFV